jgi:hypothetical protein
MNRSRPTGPPPAPGVRLARILYASITIALVAVVFLGSYI